MKKHLNIDLNTLPEEGKTFSGELDSSVFSENGEKIKATSPLEYELYVQRFDDELLVRGSLAATIEFQCDRCLTPFNKTIELIEIGICIEVTTAQIDLVDSIREELVILFPDYPHCDEGDEPNECNLDSRYLAVDKPPVDDVKTPSEQEAPNPWDALDGIKDAPSGDSE